MRITNEPAAVVFDIGNVLIRWDPQVAIAAGVGDERAARFLGDATFDFAAWNHRQDAGRGWDEGERSAIEEFPHYAEEVVAYRANFGLSLIGPVEGTARVVRELGRRGHRLVAVTNWSAELFPVAMDRFEVLGEFEDIVVSGREGMAKPDPAIFALVAERAGISLEGAVFVDDSPANVAAAAALGMDAVRFEDAPSLRHALVQRGVLGEA